MLILQSTTKDRIDLVDEITGVKIEICITKIWVSTDNNDRHVKLGFNAPDRIKIIRHNAIDKTPKKRT